ncbi:hypothetical protein BG004_006264 [Podila humilis]|nr:hypothetical protein BG004_006264 [Podila humilis]
MSPVVIIIIASAVIVGCAFGLLYWRQHKKVSRSMRQKTDKKRGSEQSRHYLIPHMQDEDHTAVAIAIPASIKSKALHTQYSTTRRGPLSLNENAPTIYLSGSKPNKNNSSSSRNRSNSNLSGHTTMSSMDHHRDSLEARLLRSQSSPNSEVRGVIELTAIPSIHSSQSAGGRRLYLKQTQRHNSINNNSRSGHMMDQHSIQELPEVERTSGFPLPRPLEWQRPVVADSTIISSTKVIANMIHPISPARTQTRSPSPGLRILATVTSPSEVPVVLKIKDRDVPNPALAPTSPNNLPNISRSTASNISAQPSVSTVRDLDDPFMGKEELFRKGPQALLTANMPYLVDPVTGQPMPKAHRDGTDLSTAHLVLQPYLSAVADSPPVYLPANVPDAVTAAAATKDGLQSAATTTTDEPKPSLPPILAPRIPTKSVRRESIQRTENDHQKPQQQLQKAPLSIIPASVSSIAETPIQHQLHHTHPHPPPIATHAEPPDSNDTLTQSASSPPRRTTTRPGIVGRESSSSSTASPTSTLVGTPTSATSPRSMPHPVQSLPPVKENNSITSVSRTASPSPSNTSSNISTGVSIISSLYSTAPSSEGSTGSPACLPVNTVSAAASPTVYSPTTSASIYQQRNNFDSEAIRQQSGNYYHDDFLRKYNPPSGIVPRVHPRPTPTSIPASEASINIGEFEGSESNRDTIIAIEHDDDDDDDNDDDSGEQRWMRKIAARTNHPQAAAGVGTRLSQFNFQPE